jgi:hypothetical protein
MWVVVYMARGMRTCKMVKDMLCGVGLLAMMRTVGQKDDPTVIVEILVPGPKSKRPMKSSLKERLPETKFHLKG